MMRLFALALVACLALAAPVRAQDEADATDWADAWMEAYELRTVDPGTAAEQRKRLLALVVHKHERVADRAAASLVGRRDLPPAQVKRLAKAGDERSLRIVGAHLPVQPDIVLPALTAVLADDEQKDKARAASWGLSNLEPTDRSAALEAALIAATASESWRVRWDVVRALGDLEADSEAVRQALLTLTESEGGWWDVRSAIVALRRLAVYDERFAAVLERRVRSSNNSMRKTAVDTLVAIGPAAAALVRRLADDPKVEGETRQVLAEGWIAIGPAEGVVARLGQMLASKDRQEVMRGLMWVVHRADEAAELRDVVTSSMAAQESLRAIAAAAASVAMARDVERATNILMTMCDHPDQRAVRFVLQTVGAVVRKQPERGQALAVSFVERGSATAMGIGLYLLQPGELPPGVASIVADRLLTEEDDEVAKELATTLRRFAPDEAPIIPTLRKILLDAERPSPIRTTAALVAGRLGKAQGADLKWLMTFLSGCRDEEIRHGALYEFAPLGISPPLEPRDDIERRLVALGAIGRGGVRTVADADALLAAITSEDRLVANAAAKLMPMIEAPPLRRRLIRGLLLASEPPEAGDEDPTPALARRTLAKLLD